MKVPVFPLSVGLYLSLLTAVSSAQTLPADGQGIAMQAKANGKSRSLSAAARALVERIDAHHAAKRRRVALLDRFGAMLSAEETSGPEPQAPGGTLTVDAGTNNPYSITASDTYAFVDVGDTGTGVVNHSAGTLTITSALTLGNQAGSNGTYNLSGTGVVNAVNTFVGNNGSGAFVQTGGTHNVSGQLFLGSDGTGATSTYTLGGGALNAALETIGSTGNASFVQNGGTHTVTGGSLILGDDFAGTYTLGGTGILTVSQITRNTGTGTLNFNGGTLRASAASTNFLNGLSAVNVQANGAKIDTNGFNVTISQTLQHDPTSGAPATDGGLTKLGTGTLTLIGGNTYTGGTNVNAGTLVASAISAALPAGAVNIAGGATLALSNTSTSTAYNQLGTTTFSGAGTLQKIGAGGIAFGGSGQINVSLSQGGLIDVQAGTLYGSSTNQASYASNLGGLNVASGATFNGVEGTVRVDALTGAGSLTGGYNDSGTNRGSTTVGVAGGSGTFSGVIGNNTGQSGVLTLTKAGAGTQILTGANTYTGATTISAGTLQLGNGGTTGSLSTSSAITTNGTLAFNRSNAVTQGTDFSGAALAGTGGVTQAGTGTLTLNVPETYTGATTVNAGTLAVSNNVTTTSGRLGGTSGVVLNSGGSLLLSGSATVTDRVNNAATVTVNGGGTFATGGLSEGAAPTAAGIGGAAGVGALTLTGTSRALASTLDFGNTQNGSALVFSSLASGKGSYVNILNWTGASNADNSLPTNDRLLFVADPGFSRSDLANWQFSNDAGVAFALGGVEIAYNGYFEVVPVPEPATSLGGALLVGLFGWMIFRRTGNFLRGLHGR